jgi:hypothetical protein
VITWELAVDAVTDTEQPAVPVPVEASEQVEAGVNVSEPTEDVKLTVPVGEAVMPGDVVETETVTMVGWPTTTVPLEKPIEVEVETAVTVRAAVAVAAL